MESPEKDLKLSISGQQIPELQIYAHGPGKSKNIGTVKELRRLQRIPGAEECLTAQCIAEG